jgi:regulator of extracellular matrix RemA (YlzA/DUF370 family)
LSSSAAKGRKKSARAKPDKPSERADRAGSSDVPPSMLNIGYGNLVAIHRVIAVVSSQSSPMRRLREQAGQGHKLIDATEGRRTRSMLVMDSDHVILSAINPETLATRIASGGAEGGGS